MAIVNQRYEFVLLFEVENGNPNGDPDAGNMPRIDAETGLGLVTDVCLKRKIRNYVDIAKNGTEGYDIYVREGSVLNTQHRKAYKALELEPESKKLPKELEKAKELTRFMCHHFFDIRTFGAVMSTEVNCGVVRGPVQINFARSIDPIVQQEITITRMAVPLKKTQKKRAEKWVGNSLYLMHFIGWKDIFLLSWRIKQAFQKMTLNFFGLLWLICLNMIIQRQGGKCPPVN